MKILSAKILSTLLLVVMSLGLAERATAEGPVRARLQDAKPQDQKIHKHFRHHRGHHSLERSKREAKGHGRGRGHHRFSGSSPFASSAPAPATEVAGFDGIDQYAALVDPPDGAIAVSRTHVVEVTNSNLSVWAKTYDQTGRLSAVRNTISAADLNASVSPVCRRQLVVTTRRDRRCRA